MKDKVRKTRSRNRKRTNEVQNNQPTSIGEIAGSIEAAGTNLKFFRSEHWFALEQPGLTCW